MTKLHKHFAIHIPTQACWWGAISIALSFTTLFIPNTAQNLIVSLAGSGIVYYLSHKGGKYFNII